MFSNPVPVAVALVPYQNNLIGIIRGIEPKKGLPALPGGYINSGETFEEALTRELCEETGISVPIDDWKIFHLGNALSANRILLFGICPPIANYDRHYTSPETTSIIEIVATTELCFPLHNEVKERFFGLKSTHQNTVFPLAGTLHHVDINVSDLKRSSEFWGWLLVELGYQKHDEWSSGIGWKLGHTYLDFIQCEPAYLESKFHRKHVGLNHLAFIANSRNHVDILTEKFRDRGINILYDDRHPYAAGYYAVFFEDPDRIKVEIIAPE